MPAITISDSDRTVIVTSHDCQRQTRTGMPVPVIMPVTRKVLDIRLASNTIILAV